MNIKSSFLSPVVTHDDFFTKRTKSRSNIRAAKKLMNKLNNIRDTLELRKTLTRIGSRKSYRVSHKAKDERDPLKPEVPIKMLKMLMGSKNKSNK